MASSFEPAKDIFSSGMSGLLSWWWVVLLVVILGIIGVVVWWISKYKKKNSQWTHSLIVKFELPNGEIDSKEKTIKMRRWKHKDEATPPLFELETPLIGSRIFTELEKYSGRTSYEVVLGNDGRLYIPTKVMMCKDKNALEVSVKHAGIDRARQQYNNRFEQMNETAKKIDLLTLMKYGIYATIIICIMIVAMTGIKSWGEKAQYDAASAQAEVASWDAMGETMESVNSALNTVTLILPDLKILYGNNLQGAIKGQKQNLNQS